MATGGPVYRTTKETENYERSCRAFVDLSTDVYRDILRYYMFVEPSELWNEVNACPDLKNKLTKDEQNKLNYSVHNGTISNLDLSFLYKLIRSISDQNLRLYLDKKIQAFNIWTKVQADRVLLSTLSRVQEDKVKRASRIVNYSECDCLLLSTLLRSQCPGYQIPALVPTSNRWGAKPPRTADIKLGDDIERIRILRNSRYGHVSDTCIPDSDFKTIWTELTEIMSRMDKELQTGGYYSTALAELEKTNLDGRWEKYETKIKKLNKNVKLVQLEQKKDQERTTHQVAKLSSEQKELMEKHEDITQHVATLSSEQKDLMEKHEDITQHVATLSSEQKDLIEKHEDIAQHVAILSSEQKNLVKKHEDITQNLATLRSEQMDLVEKHDTSVAELSKGAKQMKSRLERQEDSTGQLQSGVKQMESRLEKQEEFTGQLQTGVGSLNESIAQMGGKVDVMQTQVASLSLPQEISPRKLEDWRKSDNTFYPTKATTHISQTIKSRKKVLVYGLPGSGKTAAIHHIALKLKRDGCRLCCVQTFNEVKNRMDKFAEDEKQVYVIDDVFGVHGVDELKRKQWCDDNKDDLERCLNNPNISILCSSRIQVLNDAQLKPIKSRFTVVNISEGAFELSKDEQAGIFRNHAITKERKNLLTENKDELKVDIKEKVREVKCPVGCFPLVCHLYTGEEKPKLTMEEYFNKPLNVIADHLEKLKVEDRLSHFCLLLSLIYDNKLPVNIITVGDESKETKKLRKELLELCKLPVASSREDIREKMETLLQTFVKLESDMYQFEHDIIHDAVIKHVSWLPSTLHQFILRYCGSKFMRDRVHLSGVVCESEVSDGHDTESCINIRPESFTCWGVCVLDIVRDGVRTSDQLYNDIDEGRCSIHDVRVWYDNPWWDVFMYNRCVHSTEGQAAIVLALDRKFDIQTIMCTKGYSRYGGPRVTGLHWAMYEGLTHIVTKIVSMLSPTQLREVDSIHSLLCLAIRRVCGADVIQALIVGKVDVNSPDVGGNTPLCVAIRERCGTDVIQALIDGGVDVNTPDVDGNTPLCLAIRERCGTDVIQALIVGIVDVNTPDVDSNTPLCLAIRRGCGIDVIQALIGGGVDVNTPDVDCHTPLCLAIREHRDADVIQALIVGVDVNTPDVDGSTPLCLAIRKRCGRGVIQALIDNGADVNTPDVDWHTPLCLAIREHCDTDVIQALIVGGADVNTPVVYDLTPLHWYVWRGDYKITQLLVHNGADINQCDEDGRSVLYESQLRGRDTITELLQSVTRRAVCMYKGKPYNNVTDIPDLTLFDFVEHNNYQAVKILIERGDDVNQCDKDGTSVLYKSQLEGYETITELLQTHGAVCMYKGKTYPTITDIPDSEIDWWEREEIQELKWNCFHCSSSLQNRSF